MQDNHELKRQNSYLEDELGYIHVADPDKIYVRRLETIDDLTWRFRVYLPAENTYMIQMKNVRGGHGSSLKQVEDQFTLSVGFRLNPDGEWQSKLVTTAGSGATGTVPVSVVEKVIDWGATVNFRGAAEEFASDGEVELLKIGDNFGISIIPYTARSTKRDQ